MNNHFELHPRLKRPTAFGTGTNALRQMICILLLSNWCARANTNMTPVSVTGYNRDVVVESTASGPPYTSYALEFNTGEGTAFYQSGLSGTANGLPVSGLFTNSADSAVFQFQPHTANNVLALYTGTSPAGTLTLSTPTMYSSIAVIANSGSGTSPGLGTVLLTFNDGSSILTNFNAPDWFNNTANVALSGVDRINLTSGATDGGSAGNPRFYETSIPLFMFGSSNKALSSLTFNMPGSTKSTGIYAVSGLRSIDVSLPAIANSSATSVFGTSATLNGQVTSVGGETPVVTLYYGTSNGGTVAANWAHSVVLGYQTGAYAQVVTGLAPSTTYYFTAQATNGGGTVWATPSLSFTTPVFSLPAITNLPASNVQATFATLNGQVLSGGGEIPAVTVYFGTNDGGVNPASWSNSVALGGQTNSFAQTVSGLAPNTVYYFSAKATNDAGIVWATPSLSFTTAATNSPWPFVPMLTQHNDNYRDGANLNEMFLNVTNVNTNQFGLLYTRAVDDLIYAQPLVVTNVSITGRGSHNLVIVATVNDTVYAFDADDPTVTQPYWKDSFISPPNIVAPKNTDMTGACGGNYKDFVGNCGIVGTPVVDSVSGTIYMLVRTKESGIFVQRLHALDISSGLERSNSPVQITATYPGTGDGGTVDTFDSQRSNQRAGLVLVNGVVYITWSSHCDWTPYHGWVMGYDAHTLQRTNLWSTSPNGQEAAIWMSGQAPCADTNGNLYAITGNGTVDTVTNGDWGEAFLKLTPTNGTMKVASWFVPYNWSSLNGADTDLGCGGLLLIPGTTFAIGGGKAGWLYLVNRDNMGGLSTSSTSDNNVAQTWLVSSGKQFHGGACWWSTTNGSFAYIWPQSNDHLRQYQFNGSTFNTTPFAQGVTTGGSGSPGGILSLTANGTNAASGVLWAVVNTSANANQATVTGTLHAYRASNVGTELWNSDMLPRDSLGNLAKFVPPTVANGKVYMATFSNRLNVYGLFPAPVLTVSLSGTNVSLLWPTNNSPVYFLQTTTNLGSGNWTTVSTGITISNGMYKATVPQSTNPATFYRLNL